MDGQKDEGKEKERQYRRERENERKKIVILWIFLSESSSGKSLVSYQDISNITASNDDLCYVQKQQKAKYVHSISIR